MREDATFIGVEVDDALAADIATAAKLTEVCPVDIFDQAAGGTLEIVVDNLDECVLCGLCLDAAPEGGVRVIKLYDNEAVLRR
jgi:NAD-dependent dihydropyrimidine dehydrogenase PreA subunit